VRYLGDVAESQVQVPAHLAAELKLVGFPVLVVLGGDVNLVGKGDVVQLVGGPLPHTQEVQNDHFPAGVEMGHCLEGGWYIS